MKDAENTFTDGGGDPNRDFLVTLAALAGIFISAILVASLIMPSGIPPEEATPPEAEENPASP
ncbi:MAG: hypothetical protein ACYS47_16460, partial [Planctomycetota bacterium]